MRFAACARVKPSALLSSLIFARLAMMPFAIACRRSDSL